MTANLVFVGFHGAADRSSPESQNEITAALLADAGYVVRSGSAEPRQVPRLLAQLRLVIANRRWADAVVACQFSGRRAWTTYLLTQMTRRASIPTVLMLRGGSLPEAAAAHPRLIDPTLRRATRILAPSSYLQGAFEARGHRVGIAPNLARHGAAHVRQTWISLLTEIGAPLDGSLDTGCGPLSVSDVEQVADLHVAAFPSSGLTGLGRRVVRRYYRWQFSGPHPEPVAIGSWGDGVLAGFVVGGARHEAVAGFVRTSPGTLLTGAVTHPSFVRQVALSKVRTIARAIRRNRGQHVPPPGRDQQPVDGPSGRSFGILSIAVAEEHRGTGVAAELLAAAEHEARARRFSRMNLSVDADNPRAVRFYEKHGWRRSPTTPWDGKMTKDLDEPKNT